MQGNRLIPTTALVGGTLAAAFYVALARHRQAYTFAGKSVVITGGSRGLGLVLARRLVNEGARVALLARDVAELERARQDLLARGAVEGQVFAIPTDVRDQTSIQSAITQAAEACGGIDVLINAAGIINAGPLQHMQVRDFADTMDTHFWGTLYASTAALPWMRKKGHGRIVNIASLAGKLALPHMGPYSASKAAVASLSESMRNELAAENICVTVVCPATMRTGSHVNATYKGRHRQEFTGLSLLSSLPLISTDARVAARKILDACRHGDAMLIIPSVFGALPVLNLLMPNLVSHLLRLVNRFEPAPTSSKGDVLKEGWDSLSTLSPSALTVLGDQATVENNGLRGHAPLVTGAVTPSS